MADPHENIFFLGYVEFLQFAQVIINRIRQERSAIIIPEPKGVVV
jgi:hypothetical protein